MKLREAREKRAWASANHWGSWIMLVLETAWTKRKDGSRPELGDRLPDWVKGETSAQRPTESQLEAKIRILAAGFGAKPEGW